MPLARSCLTGMQQIGISDGVEPTNKATERSIRERPGRRPHLRDGRDVLPVELTARAAPSVCLSTFENTEHGADT
jgi:hypothetical protein